MNQGEHVRNLRWLSTLAAIVVVASACGRSGGGTASSTTPQSSSTQTTAPSGGTFGDLTNVCGPAPAGTTLTATDAGVTAKSVQISTVSDPGFVGRPGLNQELFDTATAFSKWCNAQGGIAGRQITLKLRDAKLTQFQQVAIQACAEKDFMMVGGGAVFDDQGQSTRLGCNLPTVAGYVVTPQASGADLTYQPVPNPVGTLSIGDFKWLTTKYPDAVKKVAIMTGSIPTTVLVANRYEEAIKSLGWTVVKKIVYNAAGEPSWRPDAEAVKQSGAKALIWVGEPTFFGTMLKTFNDIGYKLDFARMDANGYDPGLIANAGAGASGIAYIRSVFHPFLTADDAKGDPATQKYQEIVHQYVGSKGKIAYLGVQGLSGWLLFAKAATECGANLTRDCVWANIGKITTWTGGGLHAPQDVATQKPGDCFAMEQVQGAKFVLAPINPNQGIYSCDPSVLFTLKGNYGTGTKCPNPAYASDPKPSNCAK
ncbi:MAG: ABC-type branched-chain amino acid transport system, periplasmic component [Actinomycetia bacterium]|nr:ABC-type branched-chain amino acid transport system, periplasmic component [Actinomycetes bacterium]